MAALSGCLAVPFLRPGRSSPEREAHWVEIGVATTGAKALVDTNSIMPKVNVVEVRQRFILPGGSADSIVRIDQKVIYHCASRVVETLESLEHDGAGRVVDRSTAADHPIQEVQDRSLARYILDAVC